MTAWRQAARRLRQAPGFFVVSVLTMAIGLAANTTIFSLVNAVHLRPVEFPDGHALVSLGETSATRLCAGCSVGTSLPTFDDWRTRTRSFAGMAAFREEPATLAGTETPSRITAAAISPGLFEVLRVSPSAGRGFAAPADGTPPAGEVVIGHHLWLRSFGGRSDALGRTVRVNGRPRVIVGVMPPAFRFPEFSDVWIPLERGSGSGPPETDRDARDRPATGRDARDLGVVARLRPGATVTEADAEMKALASALERAYPETQRGWSARAVSLQQERSAEVGWTFWALLIAVSLVLAIVCANLAGLMLARAVRREREMAVRAALGARPSQLVSQVLAESTIVALAGGAAGLVLSLWGMELAVAGISEPVPYYIRFALDWRVFGFCAAVSALAGVAVGLAPAIQLAWPDVVRSLKQGGGTVAGAARGRRRLRAAFLAGELALSVGLLSGAGLLVKSFVRLSTPPPTVDLRNLLLADLELVGERYQSPDRVRETANALVAAAGRSGDAAAVSGTTFLAGFGATERRVEVEGLTAAPPAASPRFAHSVTPGYFDVLRLRIVRGRAFGEADGAGAAPVAVVNEQVARALQPHGDVLGQRLRLGPGAGEPWRTIVGVAVDEEAPVRAGTAPPAIVYVPFDQLPVPRVVLHVRTVTGPGAVRARLGSVVAGIDPDLPVQDVRPASDEYSRRFWFVGWTGRLFAAFAGMALLLSAIGLYGAASQLVSERAREFGVRLALGARDVDLRRLVLRQGLGLAALALVASVPVALGTAGLVRYLLFGASALDPLVHGAVAAVLAAVILLAFWLPARRAGRVDPLVVLRAE